LNRERHESALLSRFFRLKPPLFIGTAKSPQNEDDFPPKSPCYPPETWHPFDNSPLRKDTSVNQGTLISVAFAAVLLVIAIAQAIVYRQNLSRLINPHWSPLYPALLGFVNAVWKPGPEWEFAAAHLTNFVCFLFAALSFHHLLRSVWNMLATDSGKDGFLPQSAFLVIGHSFFLYAPLGMIVLMRNTPDLLLASSLHLSAACLIRIKNGPPATNGFRVSPGRAGSGISAKGIMFPLGLFVIGSTLLSPVRCGSGSAEPPPRRSPSLCSLSRSSWRSLATITVSPFLSRAVWITCSSSIVSIGTSRI
jgi:hypothetical protein